MKSILRRYPVLIALALGVAGSVALLVGVEGVFYLLNRYTKPSVQHIYTPWYPNEPVRARLEIDGRQIYDVTYHLDRARYRVTPGTAPPSAPRALVFFGGSFTWGEGVEDEKTLPAFVARQFPDHHVANFAKMGHGPQNMYHAIVAQEVLEPFADKEVVVIYIYIAAHVARVTGSMLVTSGWGSEYPYYAPDETGNFHYRGTMTSAFPLRGPLYHGLAREQVMQYFGTDIPPRNTPRALARTAQLLGAARDAALSQLRDGRFVVMIYPTSSPAAAQEASAIVPYLEARKIEFFDYSSKILPPEQDYWIPQDGHPTGKAHEAAARLLTKDLSPTQPDKTLQSVKVKLKSF